MAGAAGTGGRRSAWLGRWRAGALLAALAGGCRPAAEPPGEELYVEPVSVLQHQAYAEAVTGRFVSLADFEFSPISQQPGYAQVGHFKVTPPGRGPELKYVVNITRTGVGAMEAVLPPGCMLEFHLPEVHDLRRYTLLLAAVYSRHIRDDLKLMLRTDRAGWEAPPVLLKRGWNSVLVDLERLKGKEDFDARGVRSLRLWFSAARGPVRINVDDILLIDNRRQLAPVPAGVRVGKTGLDYELHLPHRRRPVRIRQCDDGLWRLGAAQAILEVAGGAAAGPPAGARPAEDLAAFGTRRVGAVEVLEANRLRVRVRNTWYFPSSAGQWASMAIRQVRFEHTFYGDGREVTDVVVNNAGGAPISSVRITAPEPAAWAGGQVAGSLHVRRFTQSVGRWSYLIAPHARAPKPYAANYLKPPRLEIRIGRQEACDGDIEADGFDESQGCYHVRAKAGHCRFRVVPGKEGLADAVFRVRGRWEGTVTASSEGLALRSLVRLGDGSVVFVLPGAVTRPRWVEVTGRVPVIGVE